MEPNAKPREFRSHAMPGDPGFYRELLDHMSDGVYFVDRDLRIQYWNEGASRLTGYTADELLGRPLENDILCHVDLSGRPMTQAESPVLASIADGSYREGSIYLRHKQGWRVPVLVRVQPIRGADGSVVGALEIFRDDTAQSEARRKIETMERLAFLDHLTQQPNRRCLETLLQAMLNECRGQRDTLGVLLVDLDGFKRINDSFGHACGDHVLRKVAEMLRRSLRPTDTVGRWGGDEFLALVRGVDERILERLTERCLAIARQSPILCNGSQMLTPSLSIGTALWRSGESAETLLARADEQMYRHKAKGRGTVRSV